MCAVAGLASSGTARRGCSSFRSALTRPSGPPAIEAPPASAPNSREREIAIWISSAAIGARIIVTSRASGLPSSRSSRDRAEEHREARNHHDRRRQRRRNRADQDVAILHVRQLVRHHAGQLLVVQDPEDSLGGRDRRVLGLRPVAKALGEGCGMTYTCGIGRSARTRGIRTMS